MLRRDLVILAIGGAAILATASAHVRIEGPRTTVAIDVAARGIDVTVEPAKLDCGRHAAIAGCPAKAKPRPV